jgi:phosphohistidine swiveling domain-containing protein
VKPLTANSARSELAALGGGKVANLQRLTASGLRVPAWAAIGTDVLHSVLATGSLKAEIRALLSELRPDNTARVGDRVEKLLLATPLDDAVLALIGAAYRHVGAGAIAVRSSGVEEDGESLSFAGQFESFLNVAGLPDVVASVRRCWASAYSERALSYRRRFGLTAAEAPMAVILQRLIPSKTSGVAFTTNPANGRSDQLVISAVYGLGEGIVSGAVDADTLIVDRPSGRVVESIVGEKRERYHPRSGCRGTIVTPVPEVERRALSLTQAEIDEIRAAAEAAEALFGCPQDLEWATCGGDTWILQSRPLTHPAERSVGDSRIWDNSNIIESFAGIVSPLTFTFANHSYHRVYREYCRVLGVPARVLDDMDGWLMNMLGYFNGRVYYNAINWYRVLRLQPFYALNRSAMELSLGMAPLPAERADALRPFGAIARGRERLLYLRTKTTFWWRLLRCRSTTRRFLERFYRSYEGFNDVGYERLSAEEAYARFLVLERRLLPAFGETIVLLVGLGFAFGALQRLTRRWIPDAPGWLDWQVALPSSRVESAEPAECMFALARMAVADPEIGHLVEGTPPDRARQALAAAGKDDFLAAIDGYVERFGCRSANELKLEEPDLAQEPSVLFRMLRATLAGAGQSQHRSHDADALLAERLGLLRRVAYQYARRRVQWYFHARESVRFARTRAFGVARRILRAIGDDLARMGALDAPDDIFYLRLEELRGAFEGGIMHDELRPLVELRRRLQAEHEQLEAPPRFETHGAPYWRANLDDAGWRVAGAAPDPEQHGSELRGTGAGPGVAEGRATVVSAPADVEGGIVVTYRTDPGWIAMLPSASALLIERGSPLTHVAIVARELGIPTVVQIPELTKRIHTGMRVRVDGGAGRVTIVR